MQIKILASGSAGNCAILRDKDGNQIILDCGVKYDKITVELEWGKPIYCLISHKHGDHYNLQSIDKLERAGISVYTEENFSRGSYIIINGYNIVPVRLPHCAECCSWAFVIYNTVENKSIFFATDCTELPNVADKPFDLFMIENNYDKETLGTNYAMGKIHNIGYANHLSMEYVLQWFSGRVCKPRNLIITHLSNSGNINAEKIKDRYKDYAYETYIAKPNLFVEF